MRRIVVLVALLACKPAPAAAPSPPAAPDTRRGAPPRRCSARRGPGAASSRRRPRPRQGDRCPDEPEDRYPFEDQDGCLGEVAATLRAAPAISSDIDAHTDDTAALVRRRRPRAPPTAWLRRPRPARRQPRRDRARRQPPRRVQPRPRRQAGGEARAAAAAAGAVHAVAGLDVPGFREVHVNSPAIGSCAQICSPGCVHEPPPPAPANRALAESAAAGFQAPAAASEAAALTRWLAEHPPA